MLKPAAELAVELRAPGFQVIAEHGSSVIHISEISLRADWRAELGGLQPSVDNHVQAPADQSLCISLQLGFSNQ